MAAPAERSTITITFGDVAENHAGMQGLGELAETGFTRAELEAARDALRELGADVELVDLGETLDDWNRQTVGVTGEHSLDPEAVREAQADAVVLLVRDFLSVMPRLADHAEDDHAELFRQLEGLDWDKKAWMRGRVVNKHARYNLCFADADQEPDYENKKGRVVAFDSDQPGMSTLAAVREALPKFLGPKAESLMAEGNYYYDQTCGIGFHGDGERRKVIAVRLGAQIPLVYQWYALARAHGENAPREHRKVGEPVRLDVRPGDLYVMGAKAVGTDWKKRLVPTLRHAAGSPKYTDA